MRALLRVCIAAVALLASFGSCSAAVPAAGKPDTRLETKITYHSGAIRLSDAIAEISKLGDIKINAGRSTKDWQARDIPVVICANDIKVGRLLKLMADAYYLTLATG